MAGIKALRKLLIGREDPAGTAAAATTFLRMTGTLTDQTEVVFADGDVGLLAGTLRNHKTVTGAELTVDGTCTFEQFPYILEAGVGTSTDNPTTDTGSGYIYTYTFPTTAQKTPGTYTIEGGDNEQCEKTTYAFVTQWSLTGNGGEGWNVSATWNGREINSTDSYTALTSTDIPVVEDAIFGLSKLYIDSASSDFGVTQVSATLLSATLNYTSGFIGVKTADGRRDFSFVKESMPEITLDVTFEHNSSATTEKAAWRAGTTRYVQLLIEGTALTVTGAYTKKTIKINLPGKWLTFAALEEQDGNDIVRGTLKVAYDTVGEIGGSIVVVNELAALE